MLETLAVRPRICQQIRSGPLGQWIDDFVAALARRGYATSVIRRHVRAAAIFGEWLEQQRVAVTQINETLVTRFVSGRARWRAPSRRNGRVSEVTSGVRLLAAYLWTRGVGARRAPVRARSAADQWLQWFDEHLAHVHGVTAGTRQIYRRYAEAFLTQYVGRAALDWSRVTAPTIAAFVQTQAGRLRPSSCRAPVTATRAFLRFLITRGVVPAGIDGAVPTVRQWKHATLPRALSADDVQRVLAAVEETTTGRRDRAVLLLLTRLGLRAGEVAALTVAAVDWHDGSLCVPGKGGRARRIPLPADVGAALVAALRSRPPTAPPGALFVRARPPYQPLRAPGVTAIAQRALRRAGLSVPRAGAHLFRHTVASQLVRRGVAMKAVADLLGHARLETTAIYAKLDRETLATIALPWPGGAR